MTERRHDDVNKFVRQYGKPYSAESDEYEKPHYDKPVVAGKNTPIYNAHSYHTKVPYQGIISFIEYYTEPGNLILDPFCGTGMTGVAALLAPSGARRVILNDLSPAAVHIASNYCTPCDVDELKKEFERIKEAVKEELDWLYETYHEDLETGEKIQATIQYTIWSDIFRCAPKKRDLKKQHINPDGCGSEIILWDVAVDKDSGQVKDTFKCPQCRETWKKTELLFVRSVPVITNYVYIDPKKKKPRRAEHRVTDFELERLLEIESKEIPCWFPTNAFDDTREMWRGVHRDQGITRACDFYTKRNLWALARLWEKIKSISDSDCRSIAQFAFTGIIAYVSKKQNFGGGGGGVSGTLYIPSFQMEKNVWSVFERKADKIVELWQTWSPDKTKSICIEGSATNLDGVLDNSIDYIFTDPPFGSNIFYGDCSFLWESWLQEFTDDSLEAVWNKSRKPSEGGKTLEDYKRLMSESFREMYRVLKPNRWATVVFSNSDDRVWEAIQDAAHEAGFVIYGGREFDKVQRSFKGIKGEKGQEKVISKDVLLNLHKPKVPQVRNSELKRIDDVEGYILHQIKMYFQYLSPEAPISDRTVEAITRAVQRRVLEEGCSMQGFSAGFVSDVLHKAGMKRSLVEHEGAWYPANGWLGEVIVRNEPSAVLWLTGLLSKESRRFDEIDPLWKQAKLKGNYKGARGLEELLDEFFIQIQDGAYRVPDEHERQVLKGQEEERVIRECERYLSGKQNREPSIDEIFTWIEMLASRKEWNLILAVEQTLSVNPGWQELPEGKAASDRLRYAKFATKKEKEKKVTGGEQPTLF
ncbi:MAG: DNA methylase [Deltaproteobacteria bacterium ADurb.Bin135]|nr:MAG: DNA methylase [Deltaproteobacteria bacterium ADurb.Bin135]